MFVNNIAYTIVDLRSENDQGGKNSNALSTPVTTSCIPVQSEKMKIVLPEQSISGVASDNVEVLQGVGVDTPSSGRLRKPLKHQTNQVLKDSLRRRHGSNK